ncbi:unnamed protein product [Rotaria magnacalcarata]|nr:unnamed protein product [Rotaria magnacalcarata]CAF1919784.1 unnamed protein product [Rotaria magnacalcarata]CAF1939351.1 unnamed protein product [Rotaria magnacalcarata]CAF2191441.1 unnamed protein product [Rotaria magnacalcarata]
MSVIELSQATPSRSLDERSMSPGNDDDTDGDDNSSLQEQERTYDFNNKLKHFLLTSNTEQRAARLKQQDLLKRELVREYLRSVSEPDTSRLQEIKKRFKTYCNSYEDLMNSNWAACG